MSKAIRKILLSCILASPLLVAAPAHAASETECAIWVCLPGAFESGSNCTKPFTRMLIRIATYRAPLPNFAGCIRSSELVGADRTYSFYRRVKRKRFSRRIKYADYRIQTFNGGTLDAEYYMRVNRKGRIIRSSTFEKGEAADLKDGLISDPYEAVEPGTKFDFAPKP